MQARRILILCDGLLKGGLARVVLDWANGLLARGHTVGLVLMSPRIEYEPPGLLWLRVFDHETPNGGIARWQHRNTQTRFLRDAIATFEAETGKAHLVIAAGESALRCASGIAHPNLWLSSHSSQLQAPKGGGIVARLRFRLKIAKRGARVRRLLNGKNIHLVSEGLAHELTNTLGVQPARVEVIHNPFDFDDLRQRAARSTPQSVAQDREFIVGVGEFNARKAFDRLITAFSRCRFSGDLVLIGQGPEHENLVRLAAAMGIAERVKFVPFHENHYALVKRARLLVMTSRSEGLGNVLIEALILGVPALALDCPHGPRDILEPICADALLPSGEVQLLPERIDRFVEVPYSINEAALERFRHDFVIGRLLALGESRKEVP